MELHFFLVELDQKKAIRQMVQRTNFITIKNFTDFQSVAKLDMKRRTLIHQIYLPAEFVTNTFESECVPDNHTNTTYSFELAASAAQHVSTCPQN